METTIKYLRPTTIDWPICDCCGEKVTVKDALWCEIHGRTDKCTKACWNNDALLLPNCESCDDYIHKSCSDVDSEGIRTCIICL